MMAISSSEQPAVDRVEVQLDDEIESLEARSMPRQLQLIIAHRD